MIASAALGLGMTLASTDAVAHHLRADDLTVVHVPGTPLVRPWHAVSTRQPTATARLFLAHITDGDAAGELAFSAKPRSRPTADLREPAVGRNPTRS